MKTAQSPSDILVPVLAPYACHPSASRGRLHAEPDDTMRTPFQRDRDRIIHSTAFRRLEYKTQVFVNHEGDHYRTRLTHSIEVAQLARTMSRALGLNDDLAEALALAHDLGHTPFGHAGEDGLQEVMKDFGGFDHNAQTLRILTKLEHRYAAFDGLNLTWEALEGIAKHNGPVANPPRAMAEYAKTHDLELLSFASAEAQLASLADDIAYNNHDIDDGLRSGLFTIADICEVPLVANMFEEVRTMHKGLDERRLVYEVIRRMITVMVYDVIAETSARLAAQPLASAEAVRSLGKPVVAFSAKMEQDIKLLKAFLMKHMYRHYRVNRMTSKARRIVKRLFEFFLLEPECLPDEWRSLTDGKGTRQTAETVADFIAGMTDRFAIDEYERIFNVRERS
ncbi:MAG TPA: deoxyguanosinetriphosphate triphosphohydrolase [Rickettsiales bacterium]|nr:deoxyguanosinetriphosphate triphosphohydrolase [Rickettsiales bacterium]